MKMEWVQFADRLARRLARMADRQHLVLMVRPFPPYDGPSVDPNYYVQFCWHDTDGLLAEAVSNRFLSGPARLAERKERGLSELGWNPPGTGTWGPNWDPSNYWRLWDRRHRPGRPRAWPSSPCRKSIGRSGRPI